MPERIPQPPGPHPPVVQPPPFKLRCQYCGKGHEGQGRMHEKISRDRTKRVVYYRCWHCYTVNPDGSKRQSVFKVIRQVEETVRTVREQL